MRIVLTGGAGFVGGAVARALRERGDDVVALVRDLKRAAALRELGVEVVEDDLSDVNRMIELFADADAVIHAAGSYRVGIPRSEHGAMWDANVGTTTRVLDAAEAAPRPPDRLRLDGQRLRQHARPGRRRDLSAATSRTGFSAGTTRRSTAPTKSPSSGSAPAIPIVIVMPSQVYGPGDHSSFGEQLSLANTGRLPYRALDDVGVGLVHVDDLAAGIVAALDGGVVGESYVLSGPVTRLRDAVEIAARIGGRRPPRLRLPTRLLRVMAPLGRLIGQAEPAPRSSRRRRA